MKTIKSLGILMMLCLALIPARVFGLDMGPFLVDSDGSLTIDTNYYANNYPSSQYADLNATVYRLDGQDRIPVASFAWSLTNLNSFSPGSNLSCEPVEGEATLGDSDDDAWWTGGSAFARLDNLVGGFYVIEFDSDSATSASASGQTGDILYGASWETEFYEYTIYIY